MLLELSSCRVSFDMGFFSFRGGHFVRYEKKAGDLNEPMRYRLDLWNSFIICVELYRYNIGEMIRRVAAVFNCKIRR